MSVWESELLMRSLADYKAILDNQRVPNFQIARRIPVDLAELDRADDLDSLWALHDKYMREYRDLRRKSSSGDELDPSDSSLIDLKAEIARRIMERCCFCERRCGTDRLSGKKGTCGVGAGARVSSEFLHFGEEPELVPSYTIFFSGCTFKCVFCQNWDISQNPDSGAEVSPETAAHWMERREDKARNVNWVGGDPTPNLLFILLSLALSNADLAVVWNSNMYLSEESMKLLEGIADVYLTDFKYFSDECASRYSKVENYLSVVKRNHIIAHRRAEIIIRHLVMPDHLECCTQPLFKWIADSLGPETRVNCMFQYRPEYKASSFPEIARRLTPEERSMAIKAAEEAGLRNVTT
jgi:putative pyruvate formate lyase activating enzyme